jgi:hypothetical protein
MSVDAANRRVKSIAAHVGTNASTANAFGSYRGAESVRRVVAPSRKLSRKVVTSDGRAPVMRRASRNDVH